MNHNLEDDLVELEKAIFHHSEVYLSKEVKNESSILDKALSTNSDVPGNINKDKFYDYWTQVVKVSDNVARMLVTGYALQFKNGVIPPSSFINNNKSFLDNSGFGIEEIKRLEKLGCIYRVEEQPYIVMPLSVVFSTKWRLVVDASRNLNAFLETRRVKLENLEQAESPSWGGGSKWLQMHRRSEVSSTRSIVEISPSKDRLRKMKLKSRPRLENSLFLKISTVFTEKN